MYKYDYTYNTIVVGETGCGKSCLALRFSEDRFKDNESLTIGVEFCAKSLEITDKETNKTKTIKMQVWDTAGQEAFHAITRSYYKSAIAGLLVFDVTRRTTFNKLSYYLGEMSKYGDLKNVIIVGNKIDQKKREVSKEEAQKFADNIGYEYVETSAKNGQNVTKVFQSLVEGVYAKYPDNYYKTHKGDVIMGIKRPEDSRLHVAPKKSIFSSCFRF